jgi:hypothetical protein
MPRNDQITRQWHLLRRLENSRGRKLAAVDHSVPDGGQGGTLGQGGWLRVPKVVEDTPHGIGMSCPGDFLGVLAAIRAPRTGSVSPTRPSRPYREQQRYNPRIP